MRNKWSLVILGLCGSLLPLAAWAAPARQAGPASQPAQEVNPLVAAARKAREQKAQQQNRPPLKVYTNDDLSSLKDAGVSVVGAAPAALAQPAAGAEGGEKAAGATAAAAPEAKDEGYWRKRFAEARRALADDSRELDILQREFNLKQQQYYSDPNQALREQYSRKDLDDTQAKIDAKKAAVDKDQQAIQDLQDELRKEGGDPGWATPETPSESLPAQPPSDAQPSQP